MKSNVYFPSMSYNVKWFYFFIITENQNVPGPGFIKIKLIMGLKQNNCKRVLL